MSGRRKARVTAQTITIDDAWRLFRLGVEHGGDPGWGGGSGLDDVYDNPGHSTEEQLEIREGQRDVFVAWWERGGRAARGGQ